MASVEDVSEAEPQANQGGDFLEEENEGGNTQIPQADQLIPVPVQENDIKVGEHGSLAPPPPPEEREGKMGSEGNAFPSKFWCAFLQRIDADGPSPKIIWNPGDWELRYGALHSEQGGPGNDQAPGQLSNSTQDVPARDQPLGK